MAASVSHVYYMVHFLEFFFHRSGQNSKKMEVRYFSAMFGSRKVQRKEKNTKENDFLMFGCPIKNIKENQI